MEAKADISIEEEKSGSGREEKIPNLSAADEIDLNSDDEFKAVPLHGNARDVRNEPEDIFEDIPDKKEVRLEQQAQAVAKEPSIMSSKPQVIDTPFQLLILVEIILTSYLSGI